MIWKGRKFKCVYGLETGAIYKVISSTPYCHSRGGHSVVDLINVVTGEKTEEYIKDLEGSIYYKEIK